MKTNRLNLDKFRAYGLSIQAQDQCMGGGKIVHPEFDNQYGPQVGFGGSNTKAIARATGPSLNQLEVGLDYKGMSLTTQPFSDGLNASLKVEPKCWLL